jgi:hypothetical protein
MTLANTLLANTLLANMLPASTHGIRTPPRRPSR